ncbi:MAG: hypothetical protein KKB81_05960 [Candidatus Margulisbacteria bacterium]|nr:hypothetical protein [Candidatus Margulisiibacteriota bacterium]MBU1021405.1 hypothetical protein [Candidatus Margulisiibacteriota bacterium]MBU1728326.1 hypothetical protein [Candidatus Margulisiibacteriota bacterium]MBU1955931.1 hypothetical protein [Candidatus Margulisiibacteriota bacterium]
MGNKCFNCGKENKEVKLCELQSKDGKSRRNEMLCQNCLEKIQSGELNIFGRNSKIHKDITIEITETEEKI